MTAGTITLREAAPSDGAALVALAHRTFVATYAADTPPGTTEAFVRATLTPDAIAAEVADPRTRYLVAERGRVLLGYAVASPRPLPDDVVAPTTAAAPILLGRLYVDAPAQGRGLGTRLMAAVLAGAAAGGHDLLWLTVWDRNARAIAAYRRWGFLDVGAVAFDLAGEAQVDRVMVRPTVTPLG